MKSVALRAWPAVHSGNCPHLPAAPEKVPKLVTYETSNPGAEQRFRRSKVWDLGAAEKQPLVLEGARIDGFSPDGSRLLGGVIKDGKQMQKLWDTATGQEIPGIDPSVTWFKETTAFSPNGNLFAGVAPVPARTEGARVTQFKNTLHVLDANTGKEIFSFDLGTDASFASFRMPVPLFTNDGSRVAVFRTVRGSLMNPGSRVEWLIFDAKSGSLVTSFDDPADPSTSSPSRQATQMFSDDGSQFICAVDNTVYTFDTTKGQPVHTLRGNENPIAHMVALPNGRLRTVEASGTIREWDLRPVEPVRIAVFEERRDAGGDRRGPSASETAISADGAWVARYFPVAGKDGPAESVRVWDAAGRPANTLTPLPRVSPNDLRGARPNCRPLMSADGKRVALYRAEVAIPRNNPKQEKIDPATVPPPDVTVWDVASGEELFHREVQPQGVLPMLALGCNCTQLSPDGATIALFERVRGADKATWKLTLIDVVTHREGSKIEVAGDVAGFSFSPDGRRIAVGIVGPPFEFPIRVRQVAVYDAGTGERIGTIEADTLVAPNALLTWLQIELLTWSPDGSRLAFPEPGSTRIHLTDVTTGKRVQTLDASSRGGSIGLSPNGALAFSPDGRRIACVVQQRIGRGSTVNVLDTDSGRVVLSLPTPPGLTRGGGPLRFSPDGYRLIHFGSVVESSSGPAEVVTKWYVQVTTWDATPRPVSK
jgi:WD40 repeat protein